MSDPSTAFGLLDERIQRFIWAERWTALRDIQEAAIPLIVWAQRDVIIAAATATGKTEAAFFPALTHLLQLGDAGGLIVYISPLKALINDQFARLLRLCEQLEVPVWPWHGDISAATKAKFLTRRHGVLLITPESLEALLCNRGTAIASTFERNAYFVIDELHAFIGSERGKQLQSLLHRIDHAVGREVPRIGLSATLGDMTLAAGFLRGSPKDPVAIVESASAGTGTKILVRGYEEPVSVRPKGGEPAREPTMPAQIAERLYQELRGSNNLVFPNSRREVERYTHLLNDLCARHRVPNEFWPHHGNLSREIRSETEAALKQCDHPATAVCTNTLELGIDIGAVKSVAQIGPPPSVATLRQRLGRSGRRSGEPAILRGYCVEDALGPEMSLSTELRLGLVQMAAMTSLLIERWFEPPAAKGLHMSTLVQQILSVIAEYGGVSVTELYQLLCAAPAPFAGLSKTEFGALLRHMGQKELLVQDSSGALLHGLLGEKFVNHYTFYAAFATDEEFRITAGNKTLGTMPVSQMLRVGQRILFAGKTWQVEEIDTAHKSIYVAHRAGGVPPLFSGGGGKIHTKVRQRMRDLLASSETLPFLDATAARFLAEARHNFAKQALAQSAFIELGRETQLMTWLGDAANETLACLLTHQGVFANASGPGVEVRKVGTDGGDLRAALAHIASSPLPSLAELLCDAENLFREKWDWALPMELLQRSYASLSLNFDEALAWAKAASKVTAPASPSV